jgi:TctA family transporter
LATSAVPNRLGKKEVGADFGKSTTEVLTESEGAEANVEEALEANTAAQEAQQQEGLNKSI